MDAEFQLRKPRQESSDMTTATKQRGLRQLQIFVIQRHEPQFHFDANQFYQVCQ